MIKILVDYILLPIFAYFIVTTIHELGHIVSGLFAGFRFELFVIGPLGLKRREDGKIVFYIEKNLSFWGGISSAVPTNENNDNFKKFANIIIAGPLTSLFFGILCLLLNIWLSYTFLLLVGAIAIGISIATLIPSRVGYFYSDGGRWLRIRRNQKTRVIELATFNIIQSYYVNKDCSKLNVADLQTLIEDEDPRNQFIGHYYAMNYYKDNDDLEHANKQRDDLKSLESKVPKNFAKMIS